jgi:hypothetical protein
MDASLLRSVLSDLTRASTSTPPHRRRFPDARCRAGNVRIPRSRAALAWAACGTLALGALACSSNDDGAPVRRRDDAGTPPTADAGTPIDAEAPRDLGPPPPVDFGPPLDVDSDNDGIPDSVERMIGTDPSREDTDGDGFSDGVERLAGTDATDPRSFIPPTDFYVVLPYRDPAVLRELDFTARLGRADVFFLVDTTGSMGLAISNVRSSLMSTIVPALSRAIADLRMGVGDFRDFPVEPYGERGDWPFLVRQTLTDDVAAVQAGLGRLAAGGGGDVPESQAQALHGAVTGGGATCGPDGGFGQACFREGSNPIIVVVTDAESHNGPGGAQPYDPALVTGAVSWTDAMAALNARSVRAVGVAVSVGVPLPLPFPVPGSNPARPHLEELARATSSRGASGALTVYDAAGGNVSTAVVDGVVDLAGATRQDVTSRKVDDPSDTVDATQFIKAVTPLRATRATRYDATTFFGVAGGTTVTFQVRFENDFLPQQAFVQIFRAVIEVYDLSSTVVLDRRNVYVVVPAIGGVLI